MLVSSLNMECMSSLPVKNFDAALYRQLPSPRILRETRYIRVNYRIKTEPRILFIGLYEVVTKKMKSIYEPQGTQIAGGNYEVTGGKMHKMINLRQNSA